MGFQFCLYHWPIFTGIWFIGTFLTSYLVSTFNGHVCYLLPYISDTGSLPPESCIFGQMLNFGAFFALVTIYIRYRVIILIKHKEHDLNYKLLNQWSIFFGFVLCLGLSLVANFQETSIVVLHFVGAFLAFGFGSIYFILQAYITWLSFCSKYLKYLRILLSATFLPLYIGTTIFSILAFKKFDGRDQFCWNDEDGGYILHLMATVTEWLMALFMIVYVISFYFEFKCFKIDEISFVHRC